MITLITGQPGNGKTLYTLAYVKAWAEREGRQVWYHNINDLKLPWHRCDAKVETINGRQESVPQWWLCPAGSIIVIDEAQNQGFGVRPRGQVPDWAQKLETHRHLGLDIVFITQDPSLLDSHDRKLCELHFHVVRTFGLQRAVVHEFRPVRENVLKSRKGSIEHRWKFPKEAFEWYHSAEVHTHKARVPAKVWVFLALPFVIGALSWYAWARYLNPDRKAVSVVNEQATLKPGLTPVKASAAPGQAGQKLSRAEYLDQFQPRVSGLAYTAPVYDDVTKPVHAPYPAACVQSKKRCQCYTQQGTRLEVPQTMCEQITTGGFFIAWDKPVAMATPVQAAPATVEPSPTLAGSLGGIRGAQVAPAPSQPADVEQDPARSRVRPRAS